MNGYTCQCVPGYTGLHCETGKPFLETNKLVQLEQRNSVDQLPRLEKRELICLLLFTCNYPIDLLLSLCIENCV